MRPAITPALLAFVPLLSVQAYAQQPSPQSVQRDPQALAVLQNSIAAMGGAAAVIQVTDTLVAGSVAPTSGNSAKGGTFTWKTAAAEYRYDFQLTSATQTFVSGHGHPASIHNGTVTALSSQLDFINPPFHLPALVLTGILANQQYSVTSSGKTTLNGAPAIKVRISLNTDMLSAVVSPQDWYFDATSGIPLRVEHRLPDTRRPENYVVAAEEFADFRSVSGLLLPFKITSYEEGAVVAVETVTAASFNKGLSPVDFDAPSGVAQ